MSRMSISMWKNKSGNTYAYEIISHYDPETKQSRPKKVYLGRVDPETGEIVKTSGKRGRPRKQEKQDEPVPGEAADYEKLYWDLLKQVKELEILNDRNQETIQQLRRELAEQQERAKKLDESMDCIYDIARKCVQ